MEKESIQIKSSRVLHEAVRSVEWKKNSPPPKNISSIIRGYYKPKKSVTEKEFIDYCRSQGFEVPPLVGFSSIMPDRLRVLCKHDNGSYFQYGLFEVGYPPEVVLFDSLHKVFYSAEYTHEERLECLLNEKTSHNGNS